MELQHPTEATLSSLVYVISGCFWKGAGGSRDFGQENKDTSRVSWFVGARVGACVQGTDGMVTACAAGAGSWIWCAAVPGRSSKVWPSRGTARLCLLIRALGKRFELMDACPPGSGNTVRIHPAHVRVTAQGRGQTTCMWVREQRGEAASGRGEERRVCMAMSVCAWEV